MAGRSKPTNDRRRVPSIAALPRIGVPRSRKPPANDNRASSSLVARRVAGIVTLAVALAMLLWVAITSL